MRVPSDLIVDHIDGDTLDNRKVNLRIGTLSLNSVNRKRTAGKFLRGVRKKCQRFQAYITINGKQKPLGTFDTELLAHEEYIKVAREVYGEWFPL